MASFLTIIKDAMGYRLGVALNYDNQSRIFKMDTGRHLSGEIWLATPQNLMAVINNRPKDLLPVAGQMYWPIKPEEAYSFLETNGWGADKEMRLRPRLGVPFMLIKPTHIPLIITLHCDICMKNKLEPEREPVLLAWRDGKIHQIIAKPTPEAPHITVGQLPDEVGENEEVGRVCRAGNQACLVWGDYALIPKTSDVLTLHKYVQTTELADSVTDLAKKGMFLSKDGLICEDGANSVAASGLSINQFLGDAS